MKQKQQFEEVQMLRQVLYNKGHKDLHSIFKRYSTIDKQ